MLSNKDDLGKGRMMPIHYGSKAHNFQTISSPLATQIPQAVGCAYALKLSGASSAVAVCYFGEGAASEGDFHAGLNFASTLGAPVVFICRNNGYAISTPTREQYRGDGIVSRAEGYGMIGIRVDGNDVFAVQKAVTEGRRVAVEQSRPVLIEAMTYRRGHHSTSDDSTRYRSATEMKLWQEHYNPMTRLRHFMEGKGWWDDGDERFMRDSERLAVRKALEVAEGKPKPPISAMFEDVYSEKTPNLIRQEKELMDHIAKYPEHYSTDSSEHK